MEATMAAFRAFGSHSVREATYRQVRRRGGMDQRIKERFREIIRDRAPRPGRVLEVGGPLGNKGLLNLPELLDAESPPAHPRDQRRVGVDQPPRGQLQRHAQLRRRQLRPGHVERSQFFMVCWKRAQPDQPSTITELQLLLDRVRTEYNQHRPHRSLPHRATPAALYDQLPKALPGPSRDRDSHDRVRHDRIDKSGTVTLRVHGKLRHIGVGRTHKGTHVILLVHDLDVRIVNAVTGELLHELTINPDKDYQPRTTK